MFSFDDVALGVVRELERRLEEARGVIAAEGVVLDGRPHPAVEVEAKCSAELRGWVRARPDLFGPKRVSGGGKPRKFTPRVVGGGE